MSDLTDQRHLYGEWESAIVYRRSAPCQNPQCRYMVVETWDHGAPHGYGVCTKCGKSWKADYAPPEDTDAKE